VARRNLVVVVGTVCLPCSRGLRTMKQLTEWRAWWRLQGRSMTTQREYQRYLFQLADRVPLDDATLADVLEFVADGATPAIPLLPGRAPDSGSTRDDAPRCAATDPPRSSHAGTRRPSRSSCHDDRHGAGLVDQQPTART
jgi:hypothetical protein